MNDQAARNVLFICTGNSARSILGEALMNHAARGRLRAFSAGSTPGGTVNPHALQALQEMGVPVGEPRVSGERPRSTWKVSTKSRRSPRRLSISL